MTFELKTAKVSGTADDGLIDFNCPRCGRTITRYHPSTRALFELKCPRSGSIGRSQGVCGWKDYVYFNIPPEEFRA